MNLDTFIEHLDRYGPDIDRWPDEIRARAHAFWTTSADSKMSADAAAAMDDARRLAMLLETLPQRNAAPHLAARIATRAVADREPMSGLRDWFGRTFWRPAIAATIPLALGFVLGFSYQQPRETDDTVLLETVGLLPFSRSFEELPYEE